MPITDTPAPIAEAYERLEQERRHVAVMPADERQARDKAIEHASERRRLKRRMWKPF